MTDMLRAQQNNVDVGRLRMNVIGRSEGTPIPDASISLSYSGNPTETIEELKTDESGNTEEVAVATPPLEYSMEPSGRQPFSQFTINVTAEGYRPINISGIEVLPTELSVQNVEMVTIDSPGNPVDNIVIPESTLFGNFPPKIPEDEVKPMAETGEIVLNRVVIPEYVVVHDGPPGDNTVANYYVRYRDYIKNVGSSEIYATWSDATIRANILAIMSFTMNRVFTEWYRGQGKNFTITSSTAYDHAFSFGRTIYKTISDVVDSMFENYLSRPNIRQPILTQYCDGERVTCPNWMTQWGSKFLGDQGYSAIEILRYFYGSDMYINTAESIAGIPASWPGYNLTLGATGAKVRQMQEQLARISKSYPAIPTVTPDGIYGPKTQEAVKKFQQVFGLPQTGIIDYNTWYKISAIYVAVTRIAELM
ncbi:MAG: peptidoglycan-binding protein [Lachnospiraceae bacterium]|nr:peptidoglycan-binding protein [Lachnospiraceae bacterium]